MTKSNKSYFLRKVNMDVVMQVHSKQYFYFSFSMKTIWNILYRKVFIRILISRFIRVLKVYRKIYRDRASPLLYHTQNLFQRLKHYIDKKLNAYSVPFILCWFTGILSFYFIFPHFLFLFLSILCLLFPILVKFIQLLRD